MERLSHSGITEFLARRPFSVVHFDADWDGYQKIVAERIRLIESQFEQTVSFGFVNIDSEPEFTEEIGVRNVPSVAYFSGTKLFGIVVGMQQDVAANIERLRRGVSLKKTSILSKG